MTDTLKSIGRGLAATFRLPVMLGWALLGYCTFILGAMYVVDEIRNVESASDLRDEMELREDIYEAQFNTWEVKLILYVSCQAIVSGRADHRLQWNDFYVTIQPFLGPQGQMLVDQLKVDLEANLPPLDPAMQCIQPGPPPPVPEGVQPQSLAEVIQLLEQAQSQGGG